MARKQLKRKEEEIERWNEWCESETETEKNDAGRDNCSKFSLTKKTFFPLRSSSTSSSLCCCLAVYLRHYQRQPTERKAESRTRRGHRHHSATSERCRQEKKTKLDKTKVNSASEKTKQSKRKVLVHDRQCGNGKIAKKLAVKSWTERRKETNNERVSERETATLKMKW